TGGANYPANHLSFHCSDFKGPSAFAVMKWRVGEILDPTERISNARSRRREQADPYEITPIWESDESTAFASATTLPSDAVKAGHTYRARVRMKDASGRWSHWSAPAQFKVSGP